MPEPMRLARPWITLGGCVLVVAVLYAAQDVVVPVAFAILLTFLLSPLVSALQKRLGRILAVSIVVLLAFTAIGAAGWVITRQVSALVLELPRYRQNIRQKVRDVRWLRSGKSVRELQESVEDLREEIAPETPEKAEPAPVVVNGEGGGGLWATVAPWLAPFGQVGLVITLVIFMLLERQELRNRLIRLFGHGRIALTTRAFDETGRRVSRYLLMQGCVNACYGLGVGLALWGFGVPYALFFGALGAVLRFIPYVGPLLAATGPLAVSLAVLHGWTKPLALAGTFAVLETCTNMILEPVAYAGAAGFSQVGLLVAVAFWTWLWGPLGLLLATPLTVCLVVAAKHVPALDFVTVLMSDEPVLEPSTVFYQRLLAGDGLEAAQLVDDHAEAEGEEAVYDDILLPALAYAEQDRLAGRIAPEEETQVVQTAAELLSDGVQALLAAAGEEARARPAETQPPHLVLGVGAGGASDGLGLEMLARVLRHTPLALEVPARPLGAHELVERIRAGGHRAVCIVDLPPSAPTRSRTLLKVLHRSLPRTPVLVGRWGQPHLDGDPAAAMLLAAGAEHVGATLAETRDRLCALLG